MQLTSLFKGFKEGFRKFGHLIANTINFVLLLIVFIFGIGLVSVLSKIFRKKYLEMKPKNKLKSYWTKVNIGTKNKEDYLKPF